MIMRVPLGVPGVYELPDVPLRALTGVRMDVCAFAGVAPRGPAQEPVFVASWRPKPTDEDIRNDNFRTIPVPVDSFADYRRIYGGFEGPGRLPYAVASFFENGGRRAWILRIVPEVEADGAGHRRDVARGSFGSDAGPLLHASGQPLEVQAQNPGAWGNAIEAELRFHTLTPFGFLLRPGFIELELASRADVSVGTMLRFQFPSGVFFLREVVQLRDDWSVVGTARVRVAALDFALPGLTDRAELVEGELSIFEAGKLRERHTRLGCSALHPRWLARVLLEESSLLHPIDTQLEGGLTVPDDLHTSSTGTLIDGADPYERIAPDHFFGPDPPPGPETRPSDGLGVLDALREPALFAVPDLYSPEALRPTIEAPEAPRSPDFEECGTRPAPPVVRPTIDLPLLRFDPALPADLESITQLQERVVALAQRLRFPIALLDAPPRITHARLIRWRARFESAFAAAYHPWLRVARSDDGTGRLQIIGPSGAAAGIIARKELASGLTFGPAQELGANVVSLLEEVSPARHEELFQLNMNLFTRTRGGSLLSSARTLSRDPSWRQLNVRRLVSMIERVLEEQMQWVVFEPNHAATRSELKQSIAAYLRQLFRANAFAGATEDSSFFVRCDEENNPPAWIDEGKLLVEIGVAPAEPMEFIVFRLVRSPDGTVSVEA